MFAYPDSAAPATPFLAEILEEAAAFSGTTIEPDLYKSSQAHARIQGHRSGRSVDFTKTYAQRDSGYENPVDYVGQLSEDGQRITGVWSLLDWNGTFEMTREEGAKIVREERVAADV